VEALPTTLGSVEAIPIRIVPPTPILNFLSIVAIFTVKRSNDTSPVK